MKRRDLIVQSAAGAALAVTGGVQALAGRKSHPATQSPLTGLSEPPSCCVCGKPAVGKARKFGLKLFVVKEAAHHTLRYHRHLCAEAACRMWLLAMIRVEAHYYFQRKSGTWGDWTMAMTGEVTVTPAPLALQCPADDWTEVPHETA